MEVWKDIDGYYGKYQVSSWGRVRNAESGHILKPYKNSKGYLKVGLSSGKRVMDKHRVNRLVAKIDRTFYTRAKEEMLVFPKEQQMNIFDYMEA